MKRKRYTEEQTIGIPKELEAGVLLKIGRGSMAWQPGFSIVGRAGTGDSTGNNALIPFSRRAYMELDLSVA